MFVKTIEGRLFNLEHATEILVAEDYVSAAESHEEDDSSEAVGNLVPLRRRTVSEYQVVARRHDGQGRSHAFVLWTGRSSGAAHDVFDQIEQALHALDLNEVEFEEEPIEG